jgi:hypothetical protein
MRKLLKCSQTFGISLSAFLMSKGKLLDVGLQVLLVAWTKIQ